MCETYFITERGDIHTPSHVGTSYQQVNTYAQSCSLSLHQSMFEFCGSRFSYWLFLSQPGDTNRVVICCCPHGREPEASWDRPGERNLCVCIRAKVCMCVSECHRVSARISITQRRNQQLNSCDSATSHSLPLQHTTIWMSHEMLSKAAHLQQAFRVFSPVYPTFLQQVYSLHWCVEL